MVDIDAALLLLPKTLHGRPAADILVAPRARLLRDRRRAGNMVSEVPEPLMLEALVEINFGDDNGSVARRRGDEALFEVPDARPHPVHPWRLVGARHQKYDPVLSDCTSAV